MNKTYVLDASAVLSLLMNASGANRVDQLLREALRLKSPLAISAVNWGEVFYLSWQRSSRKVVQFCSSRMIDRATVTTTVRLTS